MRELNARICVEFDKFKFDFHFWLKHTNLQKCFRNIQIYKNVFATLRFLKFVKIFWNFEIVAILKIVFCRFFTYCARAIKKTITMSHVTMYYFNIVNKSFFKRAFINFVRIAWFWHYFCNCVIVHSTMQHLCNCNCSCIATNIKIWCVKFNWKIKHVLILTISR